MIHSEWYLFQRTPQPTASRPSSIIDRNAQALYNIIGGISYTKGILNSTKKISGLRSFTLSVSLTHSLSDETGPCAQSTLFDIAKPDELLEGGLDAYVLLRALERQIDRKVGVHKYEQLLNALAHLVV